MTHAYPAWKRAYLLLLLPTLLWTGGIIASPLLLSGGEPAAGVVLRMAYSPVCHQLPERSCHVSGFPLSVCHRCAAVYAGFAFGLLLFPLLERKKHVHFRLVPFLLFLLPVALDYVLDVLGVWSNSPNSRAVSGLVAGLGLAAFVAPAWIEGWSQLSRRTSIHQQQGQAHE